MFPNPWATSIPPPVVTKPMGNNYENGAQTYPFYATPNTLQNMPVNQQNSLTINAASVMTQSLQPNAIDPAMVQKWQEWKQWELWQQQFQQWQQQTGQIAAATTQPAPPPMPPSQPLQPTQSPLIPFQNHQYPYHQAGPPLPLTNQPQINIKNEVGVKRGLEPEIQDNEKKLKIDTANNKKEIELNDETEALFEEQFKSWEEQFFKWKEQNKNHPDKVQYLEYEKKWLNWRDHLKQKCEVLKKKRELKMAEKKKEAIQLEENKLQSQQRLGFNPMMTNVASLTNNVPTSFQNLPNNSSIVLPVSENQIPGLDLVSNNENTIKGFLNVSKIIPQNQNGPIQTPDDKPFNFPKNISNPLTVNQFPVSMPHSNMNQPSTSVHQNSPSWTKYNNPVVYYNQKPPDVGNNSISMFGQQTDNSSRLPYGEDLSNSTFNSLQNQPNINYSRSFERSFNISSNETNTMYNKPPNDQLYNRNLNTSSNIFHSYDQLNANTSNLSNFNRPPEKLNIPYQQPKPCLNTTSSKPPSLLSLNVVKPILLDKPGNYSENKHIASNRYERNWNTADEEDDPENEYMEAHKKFSSEPYNDENGDDQFSNKQQRNMFNESYYTTRGPQSMRNFNNEYSRPINQARGFSMARNSDNEYHRSTSQLSRNVNHSYSREMQTIKNNDNDYYQSHNNVRSIEQGFPRVGLLSKDIDKEYSNEPDISKNNFISQKGNYGLPSRANYEPSKSNFSNNISRTNMEWNSDYIKNEGLQQPVKDIIPPLNSKKPYEEALPIDPVKIFDYRHLSTLKVIPGLSKETVVPIRVYDYKHGGKRILPWQDRGFSRRNSNHTRDLNDKEDSCVDNTDEFNKSNEINIKSTLGLSDISSIEKDTNHNKDNFNEIKEETAATIDLVVDENKIETLQSENEKNIDICVPSPPKVSKTINVEKSSHRQLLSIETLLCPPGRLNRPSKIVLILRGLPGSGKSYVAKLIKEKEVEMGGQPPRILSLDDYFMTEVTKTEIDPETHKVVERKDMEYEHDSANENLYRTSFIKAFKKKMLENYFSFYIIDAINNKVTYYKDILEISKINGFTVYIIELESDIDLCIKRNIHNRTAQDINNIMRSWVKTPDDQILLNIQPLLNSSSKSEVEMEDVSDVEMELDKEEEAVSNNNSEENKNVDFEEEDVMKLLSCKWTDTIPQEEKMKRLDGLCKKKPESSIKEWLQIPEDSYTISEQNLVVKDGKKRVRWADMEERREQEKMRAIGFVVGQTDWDRMLGRDQGESKLTQTKYI